MSVARSSSGMSTIGRIACRREEGDGSAQHGRSVIYNCHALQPIRNMPVWTYIKLVCRHGLHTVHVIRYYFCYTLSSLMRSRLQNVVQSICESAGFLKKCQRIYIKCWDRVWLSAGNKQVDILIDCNLHTVQDPQHFHGHLQAPPRSTDKWCLCRGLNSFGAMRCTYGNNTNNKKQASHLPQQNHNNTSATTTTSVVKIQVTFWYSFTDLKPAAFMCFPQ